MSRFPIPSVLAVRTARWPFAGSELDQDRASAWLLSLPLAKPRAVALAGFLVTAIAGCSLGMAVWMQDGGVGLSVLAACFPLLAHGLIEFHREASAFDRIELSPHGGMALFQDQSSVPVTLQWGSRHFLGLTMSLKTEVSLHRPSKCHTVTVWKRAIDPQQYRRLCVLHAWLIRQPSTCLSRETQ